MFDTTFTRLPSWKINTIYTSQSFDIPIESKVEKILAIPEAPYPNYMNCILITIRTICFYVFHIIFQLIHFQA